MVRRGGVACQRRSHRGIGDLLDFCLAAYLAVHEGLLLKGKLPAKLLLELIATV